jgi:tetratricopeptide (TPR) repeat protein
VRIAVLILILTISAANFGCLAAATSSTVKDSTVKELRSELKLATKEDDKPAIVELSRRILEWAPTDSNVWEQLARTQLVEKDTDRCAKTLDIWEKTVKPRPAIVDDVRGDLANRREAYKDAERFWRAYIASRPQAIETLDKLAALFEVRKAWRAGVDILNRAIALNDSAVRRVLRARFYLKLRNWDAAFADLNRANALDATDASVKEWLPKFEQLRPYLPRIKALDATLAKPGNAAGPWLARARLLTLAGQPDLALNDAIEAFDNRLPKESMRARIQSGEALLDLGRGAEAAKMNVGRDLVRTEDHHVGEKALNDLGEWDARISQNSGKPEPFVERANILRRLKQYGLALADAQSAIDIDAGNSAAHFEAAHALEGLDRVAEALKHATMSTEFNPNSVVSWYYRGVLEARRSDFGAAVESQNRSLAIRESLVALREREKCELRLGRIREAQVDSQKISGMDPQSGEP